MASRWVHVAPRWMHMGMRSCPRRPASISAPAIRSPRKTSASTSPALYISAHTSFRRYASSSSSSATSTSLTPSTQPADHPNFESILDQPPLLVRFRRKRGKGIILLVAMPLIAFALGTWQIFRLDWKNDLIAKFEDRLLRDPLALPPRIDAAYIPEFDYRRVTATGRFRHDREMLLGPRVLDGKNGFFVVTPLERDLGPNSTVLVNRGWIPADKAAQSERPASLVQGEVTVEGLLRDKWKKNMFTPDNKPEEGKFFFPDVEQMAGIAKSQPVWVEETMDFDLLKAYDREAAGIPIGRPAEVNLRNNHLQYVFTWYGLGVATTIMLGMVVRRPMRIRQSVEW